MYGFEGWGGDVQLPHYRATTESLLAVTTASKSESWCYSATATMLACRKDSDLRVMYCSRVSYSVTSI